jgi:hypothetical protein
MNLADVVEEPKCLCTHCQSMQPYRIVKMLGGCEVSCCTCNRQIEFLYDEED